MNKVYECELALETNNLHPIVLSLTEHWLTQENCTSANKFKDYRVVSIYNRVSSAHGGACILVRKDVEAAACTDIQTLAEDSIFECAAIELNLTNDFNKIIIVTIYGSPNKANIKNFI